MDNELNSHEDLTLEILESRHRKEKKELQAKVQALKKAAKNDKTKKKELAAEIIRLESDLENIHQQELDNFKPPENPSGDHEVNVEVDEEESAKPKYSKAQKRRDKKLQQDRDREAQIKVQEKENLHGPRNKEIEAINTKLKERNLSIFSVPSDGDCLYKAVAHQLAVKRHQQVTVTDLRCTVSDHIRENKVDFIPFMCNPKTLDTLSDTEFTEYCDKIRDTKVWGGQLEIRALSNSLKVPINIIQAAGPDTIEQGGEFEGPPLLVTYHRHMYKLGEHYNSTIPAEPEED